MSEVAENLIQLKNSIFAYERQYDRAFGSVTLLAVSKGQSIDKIVAAFKAGQSAFGENYLQEALTKMTALSSHLIEWHFIGRIQRNKTRKIAEHFAWVESVSDFSIAERLNAQRPVTLPPLNICLEVNINDEESKAGKRRIEEIKALAEVCLKMPQIKLRGLMSIPAPIDDFNKKRQAFRQLFVIWQELRASGFDLDTLSMGMSDDYEAAIAEGSTQIRIGTALFGPR